MKARTGIEMGIGRRLDCSSDRSDMYRVIIRRNIKEINHEENRQQKILKEVK